VVEVGAREDVRAVIVGAAERLLREEGARAVTTRAVAQAAGVQAPTIYRLFGDKDGLIDAVAEHAMATFVAAKVAAGTDPDPVADLRSGWRMQIDFALVNAELYALLNAPGRGDDSPAATAGLGVLRARVHRLAAAGLLRVDEERALAMIRAAGAGTIEVLLDAPVADRDPGLSDAMFDALAAGILTAVPPAPDTTISTVAVTFATVVPDLPALTDAERGLMTEWLTRSLEHLRTPRPT
jgi:AcrR family transcriptional regulator